MKIYLAGPITGLTFAEAVSWRKRVEQQLPKRYEVLSPLRGKDHLDNGSPLPDAFDGEMAAMLRDLEDIFECDVVLVNFGVNTKRASIGTCCEVGFAYALNKPIIAIIGDDTVHDHMFVRNMATKVVTNLGDALLELERYGTRRPASPIPA